MLLPVNHGKILQERPPLQTGRSPELRLASHRAPALADTESFSKLPAGKSVEAQAEKVDWQQAFDHGWCARTLRRSPTSDVGLLQVVLQAVLQATWQGWGGVKDSRTPRKK